MAQFQIIRDKSKNKKLIIGIVIFILIFIVGCVLIFRSASTTGPPDGKIVMCMKYISSPKLLEELKSQGINQTSGSLAEPDLNQCSHIICSDTYTETTSDNDFIWTKEQRQQYGECINLRSSYPHLKILYNVKYTPFEYYLMENDSKKRRLFINRVFNMVSRNKFDGLNLITQISMQKPSTDIDTTSNINKTGPTLLLKELNEKFQANNLLLTGAIAFENSLTFVTLNEDTAEMYKEVEHIALPIKLK